MATALDYQPRVARGWILGAGLVLALGILNALVLQTSDQLIDDAFIFFRYVDNLIAGHGLSWNPGQERVEGYTSFLWVMLLALPRALGAEPVLLAQVLNVALFLAALLFSLWMLARAAGAWHPALLVAPLLLATSATLGEAARSGMELALFAFLILCAAHLHLAAPVRATTRFLSGIVFGLLALARPEGLLVYLVCALLALWEGRADWRGALGREGVRCLGLLAVLGPHLAWRISYYHELLPNTYYAKVEFSPANLARGALGCARFLGTFRGALAAMALVAWAVAAPTRVGNLFAALLVLWLAYCALYLGLPDWQENYNYTVPIDLCACLALGWSAARLLLDGSLGRSAPWRAAGIAAGALFVAGNLAGALENNLRNGKGLRLSLDDGPGQGMTSGFIAIGKKLAELAAPGETLAAGACGAIPYYSGLVTYDALGLNDKHIARQPIRNPGTAPFGHERGDGAYLLAQEPTYVIMLPFLTKAPTRGFTGFSQSFRELSESADFKQRYEFESVALADGRTFNYFRRKPR